MPIFFLSGALFPLKDGPSFIGAIDRFNPLSYGIDGLRAALISQSRFGMVADFSIIIIVTLVLLVIGSYFFERIQA